MWAAVPSIHQPRSGTRGPHRQASSRPNNSVSQLTDAPGVSQRDLRTETCGRRILQSVPVVGCRDRFLVDAESLVWSVLDRVRCGWAPDVEKRYAAQAG